MVVVVVVVAVAKLLHEVVSEKPTASVEERVVTATTFSSLFHRCCTVYLNATHKYLAHKESCLRPPPIRLLSSTHLGGACLRVKRQIRVLGLPRRQEELAARLDAGGNFRGRDFINKRPPTWN